jgi:Ankyrin repeats (many copies)
LHENRQEGCSTVAMDWGAAYGYFEIVKFLHQNRREGCTHVALNLAAQNGHLEVVKFLNSIETKERQTQLSKWLELMDGEKSLNYFLK